MLLHRMHHGHVDIEIRKHCIKIPRSSKELSASFQAVGLVLHIILLIVLQDTMDRLVDSMQFAFLVIGHASNCL